MNKSRISLPPAGEPLPPSPDAGQPEARPAPRRPAPRKRRGRKLAWIGVLLLLLGGGGYALRQHLQAADKPTFRTAAVTTGDVERTVTALGKLKPRDYVDVGTQVSGQLKKVHVEVGDRVEAGQLIAEIDPTVYETRVRNDKAGLENLKALLGQQQAERTLAQKQLARNQRLLEARATSQEVVDENEAAVQVATARIAATRAQLKAAEATMAENVANVGYTRIYTPMAGTVVSEAALEGQTVNASQQAPVIVRVAKLDLMTLWAQVAEADINRIKPEMPVYFMTLGGAEKRWQGKVRQVLPTPEVLNDVVLYNVLVDVDNKEQLLMTDMTVQVFFLLGEAKDVPLVPMAALKPVKGGAYEARVLTAAGQPEPRVVKVGITSRSMAQVVEGLAVGDQVILGAAGEEGPRRPGGGGGRGMGGPRL